MASSVGLRSSHLSLPSSRGTEDNAIKLLEQLESFVNEEVTDNKYSYRLIAKVCHYLKSEGCRLDEDPLFRQQLDTYFNLLRNLLRKQSLSPLAKTMILQVIELRASNWMTSEEVDGYYHRKTVEFEAIDSYSSSSDIMGADVSTQSSIGTDLSKGLKTSAKPTKMQGKVYLRDEVLIRNGDSGKVNAGARERIVQITGPTEENIERAKELIDNTIKRNASPVPFECPTKAFDANLKQNNTEVIANELYGSSPVIANDVETQTLTGHTFTVNINGDVIELTTNNYDLGLKAKHLLKQLFEESLKPLRRPTETPPMLTPPAQVLKESSPAVLGRFSSQQSEETLRRPSLKSEPLIIPNNDKKIAYTRQFLMDCSRLPSSLMTPNSSVMAQIYNKAPDIIRKHMTSGENPDSTLMKSNSFTQRTAFDVWA